MYHIFVVGKVDESNYNRFVKTVQSYNSMPVNKFRFYYCICDETLKISNIHNPDNSSFHLVSERKSIYDYIGIIMKMCVFKDNDEIFLNGVGNILFLKGIHDQLLDNPSLITSDFMMGYNCKNLLIDNVNDVNLITEEQIEKVGFENFVEYNAMNLLIDESFNGAYAKFYKLKEIVDMLKQNYKDNKMQYTYFCAYGETLVIYHYLEKIDTMKFINGFVFFDKIGDSKIKNLPDSPRNTNRGLLCEMKTPLCIEGIQLYGEFENIKTSLPKDLEKVRKEVETTRREIEKKTKEHEKKQMEIDKMKEENNVLAKKNEELIEESERMQKSIDEIKQKIKQTENEICKVDEKKAKLSQENIKLDSEKSEMEKYIRQNIKKMSDIDKKKVFEIIQKNKSLGDTIPKDIIDMLTPTLTKEVNDQLKTIEKNSNEVDRLLKEL